MDSVRELREFETESEGQWGSSQFGEPNYIFYFKN
jgi:hypothetical protein